ncbi:hypothetical protein [Pseudomonas sp. RIT-To-2]|jgi:hypothetical protein|uniref:hypothetical protein n=1 Tax=Pseudomonas sp. RIT-To-2 TaxID=3462541 RepID=UPI00130366CB
MSEHSPQTYSARMAEIEAAKAEFFARGNQPQVLATYAFKPEPPRRAWIDPETVLKRKPMRITRDQRRILKQLADSL